MMKLRYRLFANTTPVVVLLTILAGAASAGEAPNGILPVERQVLIDLYTSTKGPDWTQRTNWRNTDDTDFNAPGTECSWFGVACNGGNTRIDRINLSWNNLTGTLPASLADLLSPLDLQLQGNQIAGAIPPQLGSLASLQALVLHSNLLSGSIPPELASLSSLTNLRLDDNLLSGAIPTGFGNLSQLDNLELEYNQLSGEIPASLGSLSKLIVLGLNDNMLSGTIPPALGNLAQLDDLNLAGNQLSGEIPASLGGLSKLRRLRLNNNLLTGHIPAQLANLSHVELLFVAKNLLSGSIPPQLGSLQAVQVLDLHENQLSGPIPSELANLPSIQHLDLAHNLLAGSIPTALGNLSTLFSLVLASNRLGGEIPPEIGNLSGLGRLALDANMLTGEIPTSLTNLTGLQVDLLDLNYNALYTDDPVLRAFLNSRQAGGNWEATQTVTPAGLAASTPTDSAITLTWTPITFSASTGRYRVWGRRGSTGPYRPLGATADKTTSSLVVSNLDPATTYRFVVQTITDPFVENTNTVTSPFSPPVEGSTTGNLAPAGASVDTAGGTGTVSNLNGVFEPGETATIAPAWTNHDTVTHLVNGTAAPYSEPGGYTYSITDGVSSYGTVGAGATANCDDATGNCYAIEVSDPAIRPALHWDLDWLETLSTGETRVWSLHLGDSFADAGPSSWAYGFIETLLHNGVTTGCDPANRLYCPGGNVTRDQMAVFLARALAGSDANVPTLGAVPGKGSYNCSAGGVSLFADIAPTDWFCRHAHAILAAGVTTGCDPAAGLYCPSPSVSREIMAVFVARAMAGGDANVPMALSDPSGRAYDCDPAAENTFFTDVQASAWTCRYVHYLWARGAIGGCDPANHLYCPAPPVTRDQMAKFLTNGFALTLD